MYTEKSWDYGTRLLNDTNQQYKSSAPTGSTDKNSIDKRYQHSKE